MWGLHGLESLLGSRVAGQLQLWVLIRYGALRVYGEHEPLRAALWILLPYKGTLDMLIRWKRPEGPKGSRYTLRSYMGEGREQ